MSDDGDVMTHEGTVVHMTAVIGGHSVKVIVRHARDVAEVHRRVAKDARPVVCYLCGMPADEAICYPDVDAAAEAEAGEEGIERRPLLLRGKCQICMAQSEEMQSRGLAWDRKWLWHAWEDEHGDVLQLRLLVVAGQPLWTQSTQAIYVNHQHWAQEQVAPPMCVACGEPARVSLMPKQEDDPPQPRCWECAELLDRLTSRYCYFGDEAESGGGR